MTGDSIEELQAELSKLRQENKDLKRIFRDIPDTYYRTDLDGIIIMVSPSAKTLMGCPTKDLIGQPIINYYIHPEERAVFLQKLADAGGVIRDHEHQVRRATGEIMALLNFKWVIYFWILKNKNFFFVTHSLFKRAEIYLVINELAVCL